MHKSDRSELPTLTSLRGIAALAVLAFHCGVDLSGRIGTAISHGYLAVDLFFMLSGFVLAHVYGRRFSAAECSVRAFLWARFARIYPLHLATLILLLPLYGAPGFSGAALAENLTFTQIFTWSMSWNGGAWSISAEWYAYLLFPLLAAPMLTGLRPIVAFGIVGLSLAPELTVVLSYGSGDISVGPMVLLRALPEFTGGVLLYRSFEAGWLAELWRSDATSLACALSIAVLAAFPGTELPILALLAALLLCCAHNRGWVSRLLRAPPLLFLGRISYSLYMIQGVAVAAVLAMHAHGIVTNPAALGVLLAALSIGLAVPVSFCIEYPARALLRGRRHFASGVAGGGKPDELAGISTA